MTTHHHRHDLGPSERYPFEVQVVIGEDETKSQGQHTQVLSHISNSDLLVLSENQPQHLQPQLQQQHPESATIAAGVSAAAVTTPSSSSYPALTSVSESAHASPLIPSLSPPTPIFLLSAHKRLLSLDILRGITIFVMVLVNTQGADPFVQLAHSDWFGYTLADWVFPNFIFMVGVACAIVLSPSRVADMRDFSSSSLPGAGSTLTFSGRIRALWERDSKRYKMSLRILKRSLTLFALGIIIASFDLIGIPKEQQWLRVPGVLQRISICYFVLALMVLWMPSSSSATSPKTGSVQVKRRSTGLKNITEITTKPALSFSSALSTESSSVIKYILPVVCTTLWFILTYAVQSTANQPIDQCSYGPEAINITSGDVLPGFAPLAGQLSPQWCTAQAYLDTVLFQRGRNPNNPVFDSEGSVGTLMSIVTGWFGWMMGSSIVEQQRQQKMQEKKRIVEMDDYIASVVAVNATAAGALPHELSLQPDGNKGKEIAADDKRNRLQEQLLTERRSSLLSNLSRWFMTGVCIMYSGEVLGWFLPICKGLWTPSYTLYSAGNSINALCILIFMYDIPSRPASSLPSLSQETLPRSASPSSMREMTKAVFSTSWMLLGRLFGAIGRVCTNILVCYGRNPTLIYVLSEVVKAILDKIRVDGGYDWIQTVWSFLFFKSFIQVMPPAWASFIFSMVYIMIFWPLLWVLNKKALYLRV